MLNLDPRSVLVVTDLLSLVSVIVLLSMRRRIPPSIQGVNAWMGGAFVCVFAIALIGQRDRLPDILTSVLANGLLWAGIAACVVGLRRFAGRPAPIAALGVGGVLYMAAMAWYVLWRPDYPMRLVANAFFLLLIGLALLETAYSVQPRNRYVKFMIACYVWTVGVMAFRIFTVLAGFDETSSLFEATIFQKIFLLTFGAVGLLANVAFILMVNDRLYDVLHRAAAYDPLSGLLNRGAVTDMLEREMDRSTRHGSPLSVLMMDIDHFKQINDKHGHAVGDRTIANFAARAALQLRRSDLLGRYGGEEFLAVLPETDTVLAAQVAERIRAATAAIPADGPGYTVSIGVAGYRPGMSLKELMYAADQALYQAKENGRNRIEVAGPGGD